MTPTETSQTGKVNPTDVCRACGYAWADHGVGGNCRYPTQVLRWDEYACEWRLGPA